jgi:hypothetical protein
MPDVQPPDADTDRWVQRLVPYLLGSVLYEISLMDGRAAGKRRPGLNARWHGSSTGEDEASKECATPERYRQKYLCSRRAARNIPDRAMVFGKDTAPPLALYEE